MILKFFLKIILRMVFMLGILLGGGLYLGKLAGGDSTKLLDLAQVYLHNKTVMPELPAVGNPDGLAAFGKLGNVNDLLEMAPQSTETMTQIPANNTPVQPVLRADEAINDQLNPRDNPSDWDYIASKTQKCWFHKRTRKKVCEPISIVP